MQSAFLSFCCWFIFSLVMARINKVHWKVDGYLDSIFIRKLILGNQSSVCRTHIPFTSLAANVSSEWHGIVQNQWQLSKKRHFSIPNVVLKYFVLLIYSNFETFTFSSSKVRLLGTFIHSPATSTLSEEAGCLWLERSCVAIERSVWLPECEIPFQAVFTHWLYLPFSATSSPLRTAPQPLGSASPGSCSTLRLTFQRMPCPFEAIDKWVNVLSQLIAAINNFTGLPSPCPADINFNACPQFLSTVLCHGCKAFLEWGLEHSVSCFQNQDTCTYY